MDHSLKRVLGFKPKYPKVEIGEIKVIVRDFKEDRLWLVCFFFFVVPSICLLHLGIDNGYSRPKLS